ncbi:MAG: arginine--tRNA ligase [Chloroflexi bacterium]|nr:arginine--tRNA ligase [Chloroflexota bacterium]
MIRDELRQVLGRAVEAAQKDGELPAIAVPDILIERPSGEGHGDYASSLPLKMARSARMAPMTIAGIIAAKVELPAAVAGLEVAAPGFLNFHLASAWLGDQVDQIVAAGPDYGRVDLGGGRRVQVEFVSANPTGPLTAGNGRGAALGDSLARVLSKAGYQVQREYYVNDAGNQMDAFNGSVYARYVQRFGGAVELPENGYPGDYIQTVAEAIATSHGRQFLDVPAEEAKPMLGRLGVDLLLQQIRIDLDQLGIRFDEWFHEESLFEAGKVSAAVEHLRAAGYVLEREGATWFASSTLGDDRDNVLIRSNGVPTYFASDAAYHQNKLGERKFDKVIDIWGADHQGHVPRMKAVVEAMGFDPARLAVLIYQLVNLVRDGQVVRMGKRTGQFVTLREVLDEVGPDAVRFFMVARSPDAMMDFDLDLAKAQSDVNPVYYVQYAHARTGGILRRAENIDFGDGDVTLLIDSSELALIRKMLELPEIVADAAQALAPHPLPHYAQELATALHTFYDRCRVITEDAETTKARLKLVAACKATLAATLDLIGVGAPEQM